MWSCDYRIVLFTKASGVVTCLDNSAVIKTKKDG